MCAALFPTGVIILPGAVSHKTIDRYLEEYEEAADDPDFFKLDLPGQGQSSFSREKTRTPGAKTCIIQQGGLRFEKMQVERYVIVLLLSAGHASASPVVDQRCDLHLFVG
jgi:hypothetical protein